MTARTNRTRQLTRTRKERTSPTRPTVKKRRGIKRPQKGLSHHQVTALPATRVVIALTVQPFVDVGKSISDVTADSMPERTLGPGAPGIEGLLRDLEHFGKVIDREELISGHKQ